jgi:signal transduction histidine kinase
MFSKIRNRLTVLYAGVMAIFLLTFIVVSFSGVLWVLHREEQQDIRSFAEEEAREHVALLKQKQLKEQVKTDDDDNGEKLFYYVFDKQGRLVSMEEPDAKLRPKIQDIIGDWQAANGEGRILKFHLEDGERVVVIMCSLQIYDGQELLGTVYVGEEISSYYQLLKTLLIVMFVVSILFLGAAAWVGHLLAGRAMVPITKSFNRQREFVADASHELRTPLSILLTSVDAVQTDDGNRLTGFSVQVLADMKSEIRRMTKLVSDLLTLARADAGASNIIKERFDLYTIAEQIIRSFQSVAEDSHLQLRLESISPLMVFADRERINQLLLILMDNAIKYTPAGGRIDVKISRVTGTKPGIMMMVQDTGVGISTEHCRQIFERFYRVDKVRSREEGGTGIGLSIAKWIVESHGGTIKVESTPGQGSSFIVTLPG